MRYGWRVLGLLAIVWAATASAQTISIKAFYGTFQGSGLASNSDSLYFGVPQRDFDVTISPAANGFSVSWITVLRQGGNPAHPNVKRRQDKITFVPSGAPNQWRAAEPGDPLNGKPYAWARLEGTSLIVYVFSIEADGRYDVQRYDRTFNGPTINFTFTDTRDGEPVRTVKGLLNKLSN